MAQAYFDRGRESVTSLFHLFFRKVPFMGNWTLACGIDEAVDFVAEFSFDDDALNYLRSLQNPNGIAIFSEDFLRFLARERPRVTISGIKDGDVVFPFEPFISIEGPIYFCQLLETPLLNIINFQSLIATKASRIVLAANQKPVVDFGLRRAQGFDGAISATKAAFVGGIHATSNIWAGRNFDIPLAGTQAHSFIMSYEHEREAFADFAESYKDSCVLVVDTHEPLQGIKDAALVLLDLKRRGHRPKGLRLDSGDLLHLSREARAILNRHGLQECIVVASGDLDEYAIKALEDAHAPIDVYGVGTKLVTAYDEPALGGVFKLASVKDGDKFRDTFKSSRGKESWPGHQDVVRNFKNGLMVYDVVVDKHGEKSAQRTNFDVDKSVSMHDVLMNDGLINAAPRSIHASRARGQEALKSLPTYLKKISQVEPYPVYFDEALTKKKLR